MEYDKFDDSEHAFFWFMETNEYKKTGARGGKGLGLYNRPIESADMLKVLDNLRRSRRLTMDHFRVLAHYGARRMPPDPNRPREFYAAKLWQEAMDRIQEVLEKKNVVHQKESSWPPSSF